MLTTVATQLADFIIYVYASVSAYPLKAAADLTFSNSIDVSGGDKIPRKGGPGISQVSQTLLKAPFCMLTSAFSPIFWLSTKPT